MTQRYYVDRLLPVYIQAIKDLNAQSGGNWILQEDNDPSHGIRRYGLAQALKDKYNIISLIHPAQSPDLSPIEACWNILKQRVRNRVYQTLGELKSILQEEWSRITLEEVRARISEMPQRCKQLIQTGGKPIKSELW